MKIYFISCWHEQLAIGVYNYKMNRKTDIKKL